MAQQDNSIHITPDALETPLLPIDGLSAPMQRFICEVTDCYQCSRDIVVTSLFAAVGAAIGKRISIKDGKFTNYMALWICHIARSGSNKTEPCKFIVNPLMLADRQAFKDYKSQHDIWKANGGNESGDKEPIFHQHLISDSTPEARNKVLADNPNGVMLYRDEIKGFLDDIGRYNKSGEIAQLISIHGAMDITINRKSDTPLLIERPFFSILGGIQPSILADTFGKDVLIGNGFNARWLFVFPESQPPVMYSENTIRDNISKAWEQYIINLCNADFSAINNEFILTGTAMQEYIEYYNELQKKKASADDYMAAVYSKLQINVIRWAGIAHFLGDDDELTQEMRPEAMRYAVQCMRYFELTHAKVYELMRNRNPVTTMGREEMIAKMCDIYDVQNITKFADAIGVSRPFISKCLKKYGRLRGYGYGDTETPINKDFTENNGVTLINDDDDDDEK
jgi:hypothetical protein